MWYPKLRLKLIKSCSNCWTKFGREVEKYDNVDFLTTIRNTSDNGALSSPLGCLPLHYVCASHVLSLLLSCLCPCLCMPLHLCCVCIAARSLQCMHVHALCVPLHRTCSCAELPLRCVCSCVVCIYSPYLCAVFTAALCVLLLCACPWSVCQGTCVPVNCVFLRCV